MESTAKFSNRKKGGFEIRKSLQERREKMALFGIRDQDDIGTRCVGLRESWFFERPSSRFWNVKY